MTRKRVIAYAMHESEIAAAQNTMQPVEVTDSFVVGDADETEIASLRQQGLIVEIVGDAAQEEMASTSAISPLVLGGALPHLGAAGGGAAEPMASVAGEHDYYLLWLNGPMIEDWRNQLDQLGVTMLERYPNGAAKVQLMPAEVAATVNLPFVRQLRRIDAVDAGPRFTHKLRAPGDINATGRRMLTFDIRLNQPGDAQAVKDWLEAHRIAIAGANDRKIRVFLLEGDAAMGDIPALPGVASFEEYVAPRLHNDVARRLIAIDANPAGSLLDETGDGQIVGVADTGIDANHPDFAGRVASVVALGRSTSDDPHGHGTHVAGSVLGDGSASGGQFKGAAPKAQLFFQSLLDAQGGLGGLPFDLGDLFEEAYAAGARVHNNSWGAATESRYTVSSAEVDDFVARRRDMLIVISAGNEGVASEPRNNSDKGFVDWLSIGSPASSKNALTVGASRNERTTGGYSSKTYGEAWPGDFPDPPIANQPISGDPQCLAAFSSRGPCDDRRIKPDVVAPGTDIASTKSSIAPLRNFWGAVSAQPKYAYMGGTSMSAPLVAGCAALVREYFVKKRGHSPSAALVKATLINGADWLSGPDSLAPTQGTPNYHQGFGRVNMAMALPNAALPSRKLEFVDDWQPGAGFTTSGQRRRYQLTLGPGNTSLRICLAYTDHPARGLQNNLNLFVQLPDGSKVMGNAQLPSSLNIPDPDNNVEIVRIDNAAQGSYLIQVTASNLLKPPQDFALVAAGENVMAFVQI